jgi:hypothetical protein
VKYERDMKIVIHMLDIAFGHGGYATGKKDADKAWKIMEQFTDVLFDMAFIGSDKAKLLKEALLRIVEYGGAQSAIQELGEDERPWSARYGTKNERKNAV